ncbi:DUF3556 domain-containing protein [Rhodococcus zopfii]|uniref:DUF3556 domain-containing protein n=1 Tax=Rhodococcus zopfii TaxID=43772 RepID=UPI000932EB53|nr:DUF3556 domain-containing protein [Rhodococcus zopfii]
MGYFVPDLPPDNPADIVRMPTFERIRYLATHWVDYGFGTAKKTHVGYTVKVLIYAILGITIATVTTGAGAPWGVADWWSEPIVYQKMVIFTVLWEMLGLGASSGPMAFRFSPRVGGHRYWLRSGTLRNPPWPGKVPFTKGGVRTEYDVALYASVILSLVVILVLPGVQSTSMAAVHPEATAGLLNPVLLWPLLVLAVVMGLRDKVTFLAMRAEQYLPAVVFFAALPFTDMIVACKLLMIVIWVGAGVSKFGHHFTKVVPVMMSNAPIMVSKTLKRKLYKNFPNDLRPSPRASGVAHILGTVVEIVAPLIMLFSTNHTITLFAVLLMVAFHITILLTFPVAVPLEWNAMFAFVAAFLFLGFPTWDGYAVSDISSPWLTAGIIAALCFFPVLGNLRPDLVSFLPSMRQYAGNWASAMWAFAPGAEKKLADKVLMSSPNQVDQLGAAYGYDLAEMLLQKAIAWRAMHTQGPAMLSALSRNLDDIDRYTLREGESMIANLVGWHFGDGHLFNELLLTEIQRRAQFEPGEVVVVWIESQPLHKNYLEYKVIDLGLGVIERGTYTVKDAREPQPWLPDGPIPMNITWTRSSTNESSLTVESR